MADARKLMPLILRWEGGYSNHPKDKGGATNKGVTLKTFRYWYGDDKREPDLKRMTDAQWLFIFRSGYWDVLSADDIKSQPVANILVDWAWMSGARLAAKRVQQIVGVKADGIIGARSIAAINAADPRGLFDKIKAARLRHVIEIVAKDPSQAVFQTGWRNRINSYKYE